MNRRRGGTRPTQTNMMTHTGKRFVRSSSVCCMVVGHSSIVAIRS